MANTHRNMLGGFILILLCACQSAVPPAQPIGYLSHYPAFEIQADDTLTWRARGFESRRYAQVNIAPVQFWISPRITDRRPRLVDSELVVLDYIARRVAYHSQVILEDGDPRGSNLVLRVAYLGLDADPAASGYAPLASLPVPAGSNALLVLEMEAIDQASGQQQAAAVRLIDSLRKDEEAEQESRDLQEIDLVVEQFIRQVETGTLFAPDP